METRDTALLSVDQFVQFVATDTRDRWVERLWDPEILVSGTL